MAEDTISAVTTALGEGAVGIVRISGLKALAVGETLFKAAAQFHRDHRAVLRHPEDGQRKCDYPQTASG